MPIYDYLCENCNEELEKIQKVSDASLVDCPGCGQPRLRKKLSAVGFQLKGSGWYATDFKDKPKTSASSDSHDVPAAPKETLPKEPSPKED